MKWLWNPKSKGSGIITCIPQTGRCPNDCQDCFFQGGRSYLEPLEENLPHVPSDSMAKGRIVRINDGHDSNVDRAGVERVAQRFDDYFFNTAIPHKLEEFSGPVVLTINPGVITNQGCHHLDKIPPNLMFVRFRSNAWNIPLLEAAVTRFTSRDVPVVITYMAYYKTPIPEEFKGYYEFRKRTKNAYWCIKRGFAMTRIEALFTNNPLVYSCGYKNSSSCARCGNCIREYYNAKERLRKEE